MTKDEIFLIVQDIFRDIFDDVNLEIRNETNSDEIEEWDSLNHINLVCAIEKEFNIKFALGELETLKDVGALVVLMNNKIKKINETI